MTIEKRILQIPTQILSKPGRFEDIDTGDKREQKITKQDGSVEIEQVPIMQRVYRNPVYNDRIIEKEVYIVKTGSEEHEFSSEIDAKRFLEGK